MITNLDVKKVKLSELNFDDRNARKHDKKNLKSIRDSLDKFGQVEPLVVQKSTMKVIGGNGRLAAMKELKWKDCDIAVIDIDDDKAKALGLVLNRSAELAEWDDDNLKSILSELNDSGWDLEGLGWDSDDLVEILPKQDDDASGLSEEDNAYTKKIKAPIYEPTGPKPDVKELFDTTKADELIKKIEASDLPKKEKDFLRYAAYRHIVFNYQNVAEYYAHSEKSAQELFEDSALVIIDFNKAIEAGFVSLSKEVAEAYANENE